MVKSNAVRLDVVFHALSDETRRSILRAVAKKENTIGEIAKPYAMSLAAISKHLQVLDAADLIPRERRGSFESIRLNAKSLYPFLTGRCIGEFNSKKRSALLSKMRNHADMHISAEP